jgi:hypothetical protein
LAEVAADELDYTDALTLDENIYHVTSARGPFESVPSNPVIVSFVDVHKVASLQAHLEIFPNPVSEKINLQFNLRAPDELILEIFNTNGSCIYTKNYLCGAGSQTLNLNRADFSMSGPSGIILIRLTGQFHQFAAKVLLE